jgi:hypothetical protein
VLHWQTKEQIFSIKDKVSSPKVLRHQLFRSASTAASETCHIDLPSVSRLELLAASVVWSDLKTANLLQVWFGRKLEVSGTSEQEARARWCSVVSRKFVHLATDPETRFEFPSATTLLATNYTKLRHCYDWRTLVQSASSNKGHSLHIWNRKRD